MRRSRSSSRLVAAAVPGRRARRSRPRASSPRSSSPSWRTPTAASRSRPCRSRTSPTRSTTGRTSSRRASSSRRPARCSTGRVGAAAEARRRLARPRRDPGLRLAPGRRDARRLRRVRRLQVAHVAARNGVHDACGPERLDAIRPLAANWWAGDDPLRHLLRPAAAARRGQRGASTLSPAWFSWVGAAPTLELVARDRRRGDPRARRRRSRTASARASASSPATPRSSRPTSTARRSASRAPASWPPSAPGACAPRSTSTTPSATWTPRSTRSRLAKPRLRAAGVGVRPEHPAPVRADHARLVLASAPVRADPEAEAARRPVREDAHHPLPARRSATSRCRRCGRARRAGRPTECEW